MKKPLLLDLCCKQGGASKGYVEAGFEVIGVDIEPQPRYPFQFVQADAFDFLANEDLSDIDAIHVSPHCQGYSAIARFKDMSMYSQDVDKFREALKRTGKPYIIENVMGAPIQNGIILCGTMFDKELLWRHRHFESNVYLYEPCPHKHKGSPITIAGNMFTKEQGVYLMEIDWMDKKGLANAVPPFYTKFVGNQIIEFLGHNKNWPKNIPFLP
jgi:DNA (cytosine-5)-methyltransferase 1